MNNQLKGVTWSENVILADGDYVDRVAFNLIVNFERMLGRPIPKADLAKWLDCVALDGGLRPGDHEVMVVVTHRKSRRQLDNFAPGDYEAELNGKAFKDQLGEFAISAYPVEDIAGAEDYFAEVLELMLQQKEVRRVMVVPHAEDEHIFNKVREVIRKADDREDEKRITLFTMEPAAAVPCRHEILGYSLMAALGIRSEEVISDK